MVELRIEILKVLIIGNKHQKILPKEVNPIYYVLNYNPESTSAIIILSTDYSTFCTNKHIATSLKLNYSK